MLQCHVSLLELLLFQRDRQRRTPSLNSQFMSIHHSSPIGLENDTIFQLCFSISAMNLNARLLLRAYRLTKELFVLPSPFCNFMPLTMNLTV